MHGENSATASDGGAALRGMTSGSDSESGDGLLDLANTATVKAVDTRFERLVRRSAVIAETGNEAAMRRMPNEDEAALALEEEDLNGGRRLRSFATAIFDESGPADTFVLDDLGDEEGSSR